MKYDCGLKRIGQRRKKVINDTPVFSLSSSTIKYFFHGRNLSFYYIYHELKIGTYIYFICLFIIFVLNDLLVIFKICFCQIF